MRTSKKNNISLSDTFVILGAGITLILSLISLTAGPEESAAGYVRKGRVKEKILKVSYIYVGQGDATLVRDVRPGGKSMLIDGGAFFKDKSGSVFNAGQTYIAPYFEEEGIKKVDYIVATHKDADHIGGLAYIVDNVEVERVFSNSTPNITENYEILIAAAKRKGIMVEELKAGDTISFSKDIVCQVIGPLRNYAGGRDSENDSSLVIRIVAGKSVFVFSGDMEIPAEMDMLSYGDDIRCTFFKAPHHGSHSSSSKPFLDLIRPQVVVFSCGKNNEFGFPVIEVLRRYEDIHSDILRTDLHGTIEIVTDGKKYKIYKKE